MAARAGAGDMSQPRTRKESECGQKGCERTPASAVVTEAWEAALQGAYKLAKTERLRQLRGEHTRSFDSRGIHPFSEEVGRVFALQEIEPALREAGFDPFVLRHEARLDADTEFRDEVVQEWKTAA